MNFRLLTISLCLFTFVIYEETVLSAPFIVEREMKIIPLVAWSQQMVKSRMNNGNGLFQETSMLKWVPHVFHQVAPCCDDEGRVLFRVTFKPDSSESYQLVTPDPDAAISRFTGVICPKPRRIVR